MEHNIGYIKYPAGGKKQYVSGTLFVFRGLKRIMLRIVKALSFNADNIFKSKEWPYY